jgi:tryptophan-rich hypothetical protein
MVDQARRLQSSLVNDERVLVNKFNPKKLLNSKWTAVNPAKKEKHFLITELEFDEEGDVIRCLMEAVQSNRVAPIEWEELKNKDNWLQGWK